jgi:DeoR/GlpR family transcriptional regulator of sugar metabolism
MGTLLKEERQMHILQALQESRRVTVSELSQRFGTSEVTIRRDLAELAASGQLVRAHRGALAPAVAPEAPVVLRMSLQYEEKEVIARAGADLVQDGDSIFIGSGSTTACFARCLSNCKRLTVITNALNIATEFAALESEVTVVLTGGVLRRADLSLLGHIAEQTLPEVRVNKIFMSVQALSIAGGWMTDHMPEVANTRRILSMSQELIVLADHTKLGRTAAAFIAPASRVTTLITSQQADPLLLSQLQGLGVRIILA